MGIKFFRYFRKKFEKDNVCVVGLKGKGKDLMFGNVINRRKKPYISNIDYDNRKHYMPLDFDKIDCAGARWSDFVDGTVPYYEFPYCEAADVYVSDVGIYLPSQYCNEINKRYPYIATYQALSRQLSKNRFHINTQNLNRCYDKIREQSDTFFLCDKCIYIPKLNIVIQKIIEYDKYQSCVDRVKPCKIRVPLFNKSAKTQAKIYVDNFFNTHGNVKSHWVIYHNKSKHNTYYFAELFKRGIKNGKENEKKK